MTDCFLSLSLHVSCTFVRTTFKKCTDTPILKFAKVKNVKSSFFLPSIESVQSLFYRFNQNHLKHNKLQIL